MTTWLPALPLLGVAALVLLGPGAALLVAAGTPRREALYLAPAVSTGFVAGVGIAAAPLGVRFGWPSLAAAAVAATTLVALVRVALSRSGRRPPGIPGAPAAPRGGHGGSASRRLVLPVALALVVAVLGTRVGSALGGPGRVSQSFDAVYHLNTTRYVLDSGQGSSLHLARWSTGEGLFSPAAWHDLAALVAVDGDVVAATQVLALVVAVGVWPLSVLLLVRHLFGTRWSGLLGTAALLTGLGLFPAWALEYGVVYPLLLGIALLPAFVLLVDRATAVGSPPGRRPAELLALALAALGLGAAHPGALVTGVLVVLPLLLPRALGRARARWDAGRRLPTVATVLVALGAVAVLVAAVDRSGTVERMRMVDWPAGVTPSQATGVWLLSAPSFSRAVPWTIALLVLVGLVVAIRTPGRRWLAWAHALSAVPFVLAAAVDSDASRRLTGFWSDDPSQLIATQPVTALPLAALALVRLADRLRAPVLDAGRRLSLPPAAVLPAAATVVAIALLITTTDQSSVERLDRLAERYDTPTRAVDGTLLARDEHELLERLPDLVPAGTRLAANPWNGSGLAYAIAGVEVMVPTLEAFPTGAAAVVADGLARAHRDDGVCDAVQELGIGYALDFEALLWVEPRSTAYPGLEGLFASPAVRLVDSVGNARLYEVTACDTPS